MTEKKILRTIQKKSFEGDVEIIVPFHGGHSHVSKLLQSIFNTIYSNRYLVTLVDDSSDNVNYHSQISNAKIQGVRILRKDQNGGFGSAVNFALKNPFKFLDSEKVIPYLLIAHSDVLLSSKDWLFNLGSSLEKMKLEGVKMVSPLTNNPVENVERLSFKGKRPNIEDFILSENEFLPLYCSLCHRDLFKYIDFPESDPCISNEAIKLAEVMRSKGFLQGVCGKSWVHHEGCVTTKLFKKKRRNVAKHQTEEEF